MDGLIVGRNVHYIDRDGRHLAAIVAHVWPGQPAGDGIVNLCVFSANGAPQTQQWIFPDPEAKRPNTWHFIERA